VGQGLVHPLHEDAPAHRTAAIEAMMRNPVMEETAASLQRDRFGSGAVPKDPGSNGVGPCLRYQALRIIGLHPH
jgi:hypothetical protein